MENNGGARFSVPGSLNMEIDPIGARLIDPAAKRNVSCPYCRSANTEFFSLFGQQLLTERYYCNNCHTPFEYVKDDDTGTGL